MERPKRRKDKDNPYTIIKVNNQYFISFKDNINVKRVIEVSKEVFNAFDKFELEDKSQMNKIERHIEQNEVFEESLFKKTQNHEYESVEDEYIRKSTYNDLMNAINELPKVTKRRIKLFYFEELSTSEIAKLENCSDRMIRKSLEFGREKIKEYFVKNHKI